MDWVWGLLITGMLIPSVTAAFTWFTRYQVADLRTAMALKFSEAREERVTQIADVKREATAYTNDNRRAVDMALIAAMQDNQKFQMRVLDEFVREKSLRDTETRIMGAIEKLDNKIDKIADRHNGHNGTTGVT